MTGGARNRMACRPDRVAEAAARMAAGTAREGRGQAHGRRFEGSEGRSHQRRAKVTRRLTAA